MPPSECPVCGRRMCDHTCFERGQTFAQMMGDPPGSIKHRKGSGCCCDDCTAPGKGPKNEEERRQEALEELQVAASDILEAQTFEQIRMPEPTPSAGAVYAILVTEEGSEIGIHVQPSDALAIHKEGIAFTQAIDTDLAIWVKRQKHFLARVVWITYCTNANYSKNPYFKMRTW